MTNAITIQWRKSPERPSAQLCPLQLEALGLQVPLKCLPVRGSVLIVTDVLYHLAAAAQPGPAVLSSQASTKSITFSS